VLTRGAGFTDAFAEVPEPFSDCSQYPPSMFHKSRRDVYNRTHGPGDRLQVRYHVNVAGAAVVFEPGCVVLPKFHIDCFHPAFLGIVTVVSMVACPHYARFAFWLKDSASAGSSPSYN